MENRTILTEDKQKEDIVNLAIRAWHEYYNATPAQIAASLKISTIELQAILLARGIISTREYKERLNPGFAEGYCQRCGIKIFDEEKIPTDLHDIKQGKRLSRQRPIFTKQLNENKGGFCPSCFQRRNMEITGLTWEQVMEAAGWTRTLVPKLWTHDESGSVFDETKEISDKNLFEYKTEGEFYRAINQSPPTF